MSYMFLWCHEVNVYLFLGLYFGFLVALVIETPYLCLKKPLFNSYVLEFTNAEVCPIFAVYPFSLNVEKQLFSNVFIQVAY